MDLPQNRFKRRLLGREPLFGIWSTIPDPMAVEALAGAGFDWMVLDTEHSSVEVAEVLPLLQAAAPYPTDCLVRPVVNDTALIKRHLDQGAQTLLLPYIQNREEAEAAVAAVRYPPRGLRGVATTTRAARYGRVPDYVARADAEICLILQVETAAALDRLEAIAGTEGVDAVFIGPADLAASMGHPGQSGHPEVRDAILDAIDRLGAIGVPAGLLSQDAAFTRSCLDRGARFVATGIDMRLLVRAADALASAFRA
ncbi:HpcH/HpaI aldolase family protein [Defluviimonas salinarum]|uniref:Aldolase/citrate lyase family protein n=1 Tax=Defluviimonas salinarum TaxID=2992147 RepID=A0ABT3J0K2_9RHOB|nr:aldolase/citrate lyase family protein [Defluviimonas salinarum]